MVQQRMLHCFTHNSRLQRLLDGANLLARRICVSRKPAGGQKQKLIAVFNGRHQPAHVAVLLRGRVAFLGRNTY